MEGFRPVEFRIRRERRPCYFYARGNCKRGNDCKFAHHQELKSPSAFVARRSPTDTSLTSFPRSIHEPEPSRSIPIPLSSDTSSKFLQSAKEPPLEFSQSIPPVPRVSESKKEEDLESNRDIRDSHSTESTRDRQKKRMLLVPVNMYLLVPDLTGSTRQRLVSDQTERNSSPEDSPERSSHDRRESLSALSDEINIDDLKRDDLAKTALSAFNYVFHPVHNRPVFQAPESMKY